MAISALEIQRRRLTVLTVFRCASLAALGYAIFSGCLIIANAISFGILDSQYFIWLVMYLIGGAIPCLLSWFLAPKLLPWLVPMPELNTCGACGYGTNESDTQCPECGIQLLPETTTPLASEKSWYRGTVLIGTPILRVVGLMMILIWCSNVASQIYWYVVSGVSTAELLAGGLTIHQMQLLFGSVELLAGLAMLFKGKAIVTLMVPKPNTLRKKPKPESA